MMRWVRRAVLVVPLAVLIIAGIAVFTARPDLNSTRNDTRDRWTVLRPPLDRRYQVLQSAATNTVNAGGPQATLATQVTAELRRWSASKNDDIATQVDQANALEAMGRRLTTAVKASARLQANQTVKNSVGAFASNTPPTEAAAYNAAARKYQDARSGFLRKPVAGLLGFDAIPTYDSSG
jgi:hypothetical protein